MGKVKNTLRLAKQYGMEYGAQVTGFTLGTLIISSLFIDRIQPPSIEEQLANIEDCADAIDHDDNIRSRCSAFIFELEDEDGKLFTINPLNEANPVIAPDPETFTETALKNLEDPITVQSTTGIAVVVTSAAFTGTLMALGPKKENEPGIDQTHGLAA